jgi:ribonucleoside-triphosphate reductase
VQAHVEKRTFVEKLLALRKLGPLSLLTVEREGEPYFRPDDGEYWVGVTGLNECVQYLTGMELHDSEEAMALGGRVMNHLRWLCVLYGERVDIRCVAAQTADAALDHRFAVIDMQEFPDAVRRVVKTDTVTQDLFYTPGARVNSAAPLSPMERTRLEGRLHEYAPLGAETVVCMPDADTSPRAISDFIQKAFHQTPNRRIAVLG